MSKPISFRGKWRIRWIDHAGKRRSAVFRKHTDAQLALNRYSLEAEEIRRGLRPTPAQRKQFAELAECWLKTRAVQKRSQAQDESILRVHLVPAFGHLGLEEIHQLRCDEYINSKPALARKTLGNHLTLLIALLNHAHRIGWLGKPPEIRKPKTVDSEFSYLRTQEEITRLLNMARQQSEAAYFMYFTAIHTGMREGELAALRWDDVNWERSLITVQRSHEGPTKSGRVRYVPILDSLLPVLRAEHSRRFSALVFPNRAGNQHQKSARIFQEIFHRILDAASFPWVTRNNKPRRYIVFHDLRHTFASRWVMTGGDIYKLQRILGHASLSMTMRYAHLSPNAFDGDRDRFNDEPSAATTEPISRTVTALRSF